MFRTLVVLVFLSIGHSAFSFGTAGFTGIQDKRNTHFGCRHSAPVAPLRMRGGGENLEIPKKIKLTYFNIEGAAEKVRLALKIGGINFEDERIDFATWQNELKAKTPFGQLPLLALDDMPAVAQSFAMLRYIGRLSGLYPADPVAALHIDEVCGLQEDLAKALTPSMYIGMRPHLFGYPEDLPEEERKSIQKRLRDALMAEGGDVPRMLGYFERILKNNGGGFICGSTVTIADCALLPALRQFKSGRLDGIPVTILEKFPLLAAYYDRMMEVPAVKSHYS
jgi:glutathione S-transferase